MLHSNVKFHNDPNNPNNSNNPNNTNIRVLHQRRGVPNIHRFAAERGGLTGYMRIFFERDSIRKTDVEKSGGYKRASA